MVPTPCSCKDALQQNEVTNIFEDDFAALGDEEASSGSRRENSITEYQSFVDLTFSKNKVVSAIQWLPHRKVSRQPVCLGEDGRLFSRAAFEGGAR